MLETPHAAKRRGLLTGEHRSGHTGMFDGAAVLQQSPMPLAADTVHRYTFVMKTIACNGARIAVIGIGLRGSVDED